MRDDKEKLEKVLDSIDRIIEYTKEGPVAFLDDCKTQDAVVRNLQVIGEAIKDISVTIKKAYPTLPWRELAGLRDRITHGYFDVNYNTVWRVVEIELPPLRIQVDDLHQKLVYREPYTNGKLRRKLDEEPKPEDEQQDKGDEPQSPPRWRWRDKRSR